MMILLEVQNLRTAIKGRHTMPADFFPVDDISFTINAGEIVGLAGESGCGKSLSALSIARLLPPAAEISGGKVLYHTAGGEILNICLATEESLRPIRGKEIAMIFQEPRQSLNPLMRVGAQIAETLELHGTEKAAAHEEALNLLQKLKFPNPERILNVWPHQLSGGMCQRVMIAIAAICRPRLLIADEPITALDMVNKTHILSLLKQINHEFGTAILFISHDLSAAQDFCSRFIVMRSGKIVDSAGAYAKSLFGAMPTEKKQGKPSAVVSKSAAQPLITIRNLSNAYVSRNFGLFGKKEIKPVLNNVNLEIAAGEIFGLSGESGCGKTTLARCILGLIKYEGEILIDGQQQRIPGQMKGIIPQGMNLSFPHSLRSSIQMVFQDPGASLNPVKKIGWLMEEPLRIHRLGTAEERSRKVDEMLFRVGLDPSYKTRRPHELSGGQKQRVCIGRALMLDSKILIADEAISSLDVSVGIQILELFRELRDSLGLTIIFISHNIDAAEYLCDRIIAFKDGFYYNKDSVNKKEGML